MSQINDCIHQALGPGQINDLLLAYYQDNGATSNDINDAAREFLAVQGSDLAQINDMWYQFLRDAGYTGALNDMKLQFWCVDGGEVGGLCLYWSQGKYGVIVDPIPISGDFEMSFEAAIIPSEVGALVVVSGNNITAAGPDRFTFSQLTAGREIFMHVNGDAHQWTAPFHPRDGLLHHYRVIAIGTEMWFEQDGFRSSVFNINPAPILFTHFAVRGDNLAANMIGIFKNLRVQVPSTGTDILWEINGEETDFLPSIPPGHDVELINVDESDWVECPGYADIPLLPDILLFIGHMGLIYDEAGGTLINDRNTPATVEDYEGNILDVLPNEIRYLGARRVDHADGQMYNAGIPGIQYFDTTEGGASIEPRPRMLHEGADGAVDIDNINIPLVEGVNFNNAEGILVFRYTLDEDQANISEVQGLLGLRDIQQTSLLRGNSTMQQMVSSASSGASALVSLPSFVSGQDFICSVIWDADTSEYVTGVSLDGGDTYTWGATAVYDGAYLLEGIYRLFLNSPYTSDLDFALITGELIEGSIAESKAAVEGTIWPGGGAPSNAVLHNGEVVEFNGEVVTHG